MFGHFTNPCESCYNPSKVLHISQQGLKYSLTISYDSSEPKPRNLSVTSALSTPFEIEFLKNRLEGFFWGFFFFLVLNSVQQQNNPMLQILLTNISHMIHRLGHLRESASNGSVSDRVSEEALVTSDQMEVTAEGLSCCTACQHLSKITLFNLLKVTRAVFTVCKI